MHLDAPILARKVRLGPELSVSQVCFGTEHIIKYSPPVGGQILADAARLHGVFFWDTAPIYKSQPHVAAGLRLMPREHVVVTSKTYAESGQDAEKHLDAILKELGTDYLDLCLLHRIMPGHLESRLPALEVLVRAKVMGRVRSVGLSTHSPRIVLGGAKIPEIDVICTTLNSTGHSFDEGTPEEMLDLPYTHK